MENFWGVPHLRISPWNIIKLPGWWVDMSWRFAPLFVEGERFNVQQTHHGDQKPPFCHRSRDGPARRVSLQKVALAIWTQQNFNKHLKIRQRILESTKKTAKHCTQDTYIYIYIYIHSSIVYYFKSYFIRWYYVKLYSYIKLDDIRSY